MRLRLGAALSLLMLLCAPAPSARAGCSAHYLNLRPQAAAEALALDPLLLSGSALPPHDELPPSRPAPCSGALCSGNPAAPLSTVPFGMTESNYDRAISGHHPILTDPGSLVRSDEDARFIPVHHSSSIFHPPRRPSRRPTT